MKRKALTWALIICLFILVAEVGFIAWATVTRALDPTEPTELTEQTQPTDESTEPTEQTDATEETEPTEVTTEPTTEPTEATAVTEATEATAATEATEPTTETTEPTETAGGYVLRKNGAKCTYGDDYTAHATIKVGESFKLAIVDSNNTTQDVVWSASKEGICTVTGTTVKGAAAGNVTLSVSLGGKTYRCYLIVK